MGNSHGLSERIDELAQHMEETFTRLSEQVKGLEAKCNDLWDLLETSTKKSTPKLEPKPKKVEAPKESQ